MSFLEFHQNCNEINRVSISFSHLLKHSFDTHIHTQMLTLIQFITSTLQIFHANWDFYRVTWPNIISIVHIHMISVIFTFSNLIKFQCSGNFGSWHTTERTYGIFFKVVVPWLWFFFYILKAYIKWKCFMFHASYRRPHTVRSSSYSITSS